MDHPSISDLKYIADLAYSVLEDDGDATDEEWQRLHRVEAWLVDMAVLEEDAAAQAKLALAVLEEHGLSADMVEKVFVASTAHVSEETAKRLGANEIAGLIYYEHGKQGWLIYAEEPEPSGAQRPEDLQACLAMAGSLGCTWLLLDADATPVPMLNRYDW
ncbi:hypothetical protein V3589_10855 [Sinorhizobium fredii]|uniref:DUF5983 family protein n=1 Tax=Rhizobium fredii TaxID=380 RepID=UPI0030A2317B